jgi:hypothetical protein
MPLQATSGAASYDAFGGGVPVVPTYIEDVFNTYLYTGTSAGTQTFTNGIDLSAKGGLVWSKKRDGAAQEHYLADSNSSWSKVLSSNSTGIGYTIANWVVPLSNGFTLKVGDFLNPAETGVSWTFRKQPKFFDVVTYTGNDVFDRVISHNLGAVPAVIIIKCTSSATDWVVRTTVIDGSMDLLYLNLTNAKTDSSVSNTWSSSTFTVGASAADNQTGQTYVAYLFASNAGGFGLTGTDNVISCGSFTTDGSGNFSVNLGYEPQWVMIKSTNNTGVSAAQQNWIIMDSMRGFLTQSGNGARLRANTSEAESTTNDFGPTATGFESLGNMSASAPFIYIAIRRGPMKVPTSGTSVYNNLANRVGTSATATISGVGFPVDLMLPFNETSGSSKPFVDRLRGATKYLLPPYSNAEQTNTDVVTSFASNDGVIVGADSLDVINNYYNASRRYAASFFRRAPSVFDIVCYTGNGAGSNAKTHNLTVAPELLIIKNRSSSGSGDWFTFHTFTVSNFKKQLLDTTDAQTNYSYGSFLDAQPSSTTFTVNSGAGCNESGTTYVAYLFATCAGVSKVGLYTGTGALQTVNCGFTSGARFILIKRTDSTGDWYMYDSARGISASSDPYLILNTTGTSELGTNYVDTDSTGFKVTAAAPAALNANGGSFIFLAIA